MKNFNIVLVGFIGGGGQIMLNKRPDSEVEVWELIGGSIEEDELATAAIIREVNEELRYAVAVERDELRLAKVLTVQTDDFSARVHFYEARFPGFEHFEDTEEARVSDLKLFPVQEALTLNLLPMTRSILESMQ